MSNVTIKLYYLSIKIIYFHDMHFMTNIVIKLVFIDFVTDDLILIIKGTDGYEILVDIFKVLRRS